MVCACYVLESSEGGKSGPMSPSEPVLVDSEIALNQADLIVMHG
jgi:hypothetical protein